MSVYTLLTMIVLFSENLIALLSNNAFNIFFAGAPDFEIPASNISFRSGGFKSIGVGGFLDTDLGRSISKVVEISLG